jgi:hypothetical protein
MQKDRLCVAEGSVPVLLYFPPAQTGQDVVKANLRDWIARQESKQQDTTTIHAGTTLTRFCSSVAMISASVTSSPFMLGVDWAWELCLLVRVAKGDQSNRTRFVCVCVCECVCVCVCVCV